MTNYKYIELDNDGNIVSFGDSTSMELALQDTKGKVLQLTDMEYLLVDSCHGRLYRGISTLTTLQRRIRDVIGNPWED
jgi:hypothetical protein